MSLIFWSVSISRFLSFILEVLNDFIYLLTHIVFNLLDYMCKIH